MEFLIAAVSTPVNFDAATATDAYIATMDAAARARSDAYFEGGYWLIPVNLIAGLAMAGLLLQTGFSKGLRDRVQGLVRSKSLTVALYAAIYTIVTTLILFPLTLWQGYFREHAYGLSTMSLGGWLNEQAIGLVTGVIMAAIFLTIFYLVLGLARRAWWIWGAGVSVILLAVAIFISPVYIDPLFNEYQPMEEGELRDDILALADANGIPADNVYVFDVSRQSNRITANVNGLFGTTRIALSDTLIDNTDPDEVLAVMGHEMGHYALNHLWEMFIIFAVVLAIGFAFTDRLFAFVNGRFGKSWGVSGISDIAGLPLLAACLSVYFFIATPVFNTVIRTNEAEADIFGLNAAREPDGFATAALRLASYRKIDPGRWEEFIFFDHPSGRARIAMSMQWKAGQLALGAQDQTPELRLDRARAISDALVEGPETRQE
ncbi:M48 family metallopeptidase [Hyphobacterium sp. CCMP332]|uniref:M48 family metallopeptidase n=1 Tax=Hyphobacterium sp. CCMP332 TaxID=2749086 RepID=UPI00164FDAFA|nr:M48 family metallopeptidase [Hyphobacterium sp. CCMP332]QNL19878.1 M48 family metallopeptidase [Hyphobacterium sp. CCMP332]